MANPVIPKCAFGVPQQSAATYMNPGFNYGDTPTGDDLPGMFKTTYSNFNARVFDQSVRLDKATEASIKSETWSDEAVNSLFSFGWLNAVAKTASCVLYALAKIVMAVLNLATACFREGALATAKQQAVQALAGLTGAFRGVFQSVPVIGNVVLALLDKGYNKFKESCCSSDETSHPAPTQPGAESAERTAPSESL